MAANRIEQLIDEIYDFAEGCKPAAFNSGKIIVSKDDLFDLLDELKARTPDEIKRYQKIIANRDAIIAKAEDDAEKIREEAREEAKRLVSEHEIMQQAYARVNEMVTDASKEAEERVAKAKLEAEQLSTGALNYANNIMYDMEKILSDAFEATKQRSENLVNTLKESYEAVAENRLQIYNQLNPNYLTEEFGDAGTSSGKNDDYDDLDDVDDEPVDDKTSSDDDYAEEDDDDFPEEDDEDYDFDEDAFLDNIDE